MKYRKKPVVIEAMRWDGSLKSTDDATYWCGGQYDHTDMAEWIAIPTLEGVMRASPGDWIIRGVKGEFYPCKDDIFQATYEPIEVDQRPHSRACGAHPHQHGAACHRNCPTCHSQETP